MSVADLLVDLFEQLVAAGNGWHDLDTTVRLGLLFVLTTAFGGRVVHLGLDRVGASRLQQHLRHGRHRYMRTIRRLRPRHLLFRALPNHLRPPNRGHLTHWRWREVGLLCCVITPVRLIDVGILWVGVPWLARQVALPIGVGLAAATLLWATGSAHRPMSGRVAAGGIIAFVWLAASPELAVGGLAFLFVFAALNWATMKAIYDLSTVLVGLRWFNPS